MAGKKRGPWTVIKSFLFWLHKWLGLASALVLTVVCLSGTVYVFRNEVVELLNPSVFKVEVPDAELTLPLEALIAQVSEASGARPRSVTLDPRADRSWVFNVQREGDGRRGSNLHVNPYTGEVLPSDHLRGNDFFFWVFRLHRWLLLDTSVGRPIVGWATIIMLLLIVTGLVVWLPKKWGKLKQRLVVHWRGGRRRFTFDLHSTLGFYSAILLFVMAFTGLFWSFDWSRQLIYDVLQVEAPQRGGSQAAPQRGVGQDRNQGKLALASDSVQGLEGAVPVSFLTYAELLAKADSVLPYKGVYRLTLPSPDAASFQLSKSHSGFFAYSGSDQLELSRTDGAVRALELFRDKPLNEQLAASIKPLHTGEIFGTFSKILYFIACLIASSLPITGFILWWWKQVKGRKKA